MKNGKPKNVDDYFKTLPADKKRVLQDLRNIIRSVAPQAEEVISYQMPTFRYHGGLLSYAAFKDHCSLFPWNSTLIKKFGKELESYATAKGTIRFTTEKPLPVSLIKKITKARMKENEEKLLSKKQKSKT